MKRLKTDLEMAVAGLCLATPKEITDLREKIKEDWKRSPMLARWGQRMCALVVRMNGERDAKNSA